MSIKKNWPKYALQWGVLAILIIFITGLAKLVIPALEAADPERYCPMGGLQALATYFFRGSLPCSMSTVQIVMGVALAAAVILFSKLFCGYICPVGTIQDLMSKLRGKLRIKGIRIPQGSIADKALRILKYALAFVIFYITTTHSELFCKNLDPYYAVATGFKGEITLWMAISTVLLVIVGGFFIDNLWCKYLCPLGAISNSLKFWAWMLVLVAIYWLTDIIGLAIPWALLLGVFCLAGYLLEILCAKPKLQLLHVIRDEAACNNCGLCEKKCPYHIDIKSFGNGRVCSVDCTLCGECVAACNAGALAVGVNSKCKGKAWKYVPAILTVVLIALGIWLGTRPSFEIPTINETWGIEMMGPDSTMVQLVDPSTLETMEVTGLKSVKCFGSSTAFKNKLMNIKGVHGVKTFVVHHRAVITYDPAKTSPEAIQEEIFVPVHIKTEKRVDPAVAERLKVVTFHTDNMFDRMDFTYLGLQFRDNEKEIYGLESEFACPLIVRLFVGENEEITEDWLEEIVERDELVTRNPKTGEVIKSIPVDFKFVDMVEEPEYISVSDFVHKFFDGFSSGDFNGRYTDGNGESFVEKRAEHYAGEQQYVFEIADQDFEKPIFKRANAFQFLSNHVSRHEGVISLDVEINSSLVPAIHIRYAAPMTAEKLWDILNEDPWTITYAVDDVREEPARIKFDTVDSVTHFEYTPAE